MGVEGDHSAVAERAYARPRDAVVAPEQNDRFAGLQRVLNGLTDWLECLLGAKRRDVEITHVGNPDRGELAVVDHVVWAVPFKRAANGCRSQVAPPGRDGAQMERNSEDCQFR